MTNSDEKSKLFESECDFEFDGVSRFVRDYLPLNDVATCQTILWSNSGIGCNSYYLKKKLDVDLVISFFCFFFVLFFLVCCFRLNIAELFVLCANQIVTRCDLLVIHLFSQTNKKHTHSHYTIEKRTVFQQKRTL